MRLLGVLTCALALLGLAFSADTNEDISLRNNKPLGLFSLVRGGMRLARGGYGMLRTGTIGSLRLVKSGANFGTDLVSQTASGVTGIGKQVVDTVADTKLVIVRGGLGLADQAMDLTRNITSYVPGVGSVVAVGTALGMKGTAFANKTAHTGVGYFQQAGNYGLDKINQGLQAGAQLTSTLVELGAEKGESTLKKGFKAIDSTINNGEERALKAASSIDSRLGLTASSETPPPPSTDE